MLRVEEIIDLFDMRPLEPEGGYIAVTNMSDIVVDKDCLPERYTEDKPVCGAILYLMTGDAFSHMHYLPTDEIYHFYLGDPVEQLVLLPDGTGEVRTLGQDVLNGQLVQAVVPAGSWHGSKLAPGGTLALVGTTMGPAYTDSDYIHGERAELIGKYPVFEKEIIALTR